MRTSMLLKMLLTAAMSPLFATDDETASAASTTDGAAADSASTGTSTADAAPDAGTVATADTASTDASADTSTEAPAAATQTTAPVQTPTPVAQPGSAGDPVLETVKTPAHTVAAEIQAELEKIEELPEEVAAWFKAKFVELSSHIKALL